MRGIPKSHTQRATLQRTTHFTPHYAVVPPPQERPSRSCRAAPGRAACKLAVSAAGPAAYCPALRLEGEGQGVTLYLKSHGSFTYYFAYMAQCTPLFAFTVFHLIWGCNNNFFHDYDVFFLPFTVFNAGRKKRADESYLLRASHTSC